MTHKCFFIFCGNEHGFGDVCFPDITKMHPEEIREHAAVENSIIAIRRKAKAEGWGRVNGEDYCPGCMASMSDS